MVDFPNQAGPMCEWPKVAAVRGAQACLAALSQHASCHIATNAQDSSLSQIHKALSRVGLAQYIQSIFCFDSLAMAKTQPGYYHNIVKVLNVQAQDIVMIGDSLENDVYPALEAGLSAIWFNPRRQAIPENIQSINHLGELGAYE